MTQLILRTGDLFTSDAPALGHGVNLVGVMGAGIAPVFKRLYPQMFVAYQSMCQSDFFVPGGVFVWQDEDRRIYNLASQDLPGAHARLDWLESSVRAALADCDTEGLDRLAIPRVGCGIGGLLWPDVLGVLTAIVPDFTCDLEVWTLPGQGE